MVCLDESISKWLNMFTCPSFVFCPRKPWPFGNKWHTIACILRSIIFHIKLVEGRDCPYELSAQKFNLITGKMAKTVGLMLRMIESILHRSRVVILDSGFCVFGRLTELAKRGVFASAIIKKRRYWPKYIRGDDIKADFVTKKIGDSNALHGTLDGASFLVFCMKEEDYVMSLTKTYGKMEEMGKTGQLIEDNTKKLPSIELK